MGNNSLRTTTVAYCNGMAIYSHSCIMVNNSGSLRLNTATTRTISTLGKMLATTNTTAFATIEFMVIVKVEEWCG